jgi:hypothetical protein
MEPHDGQPSPPSVPTSVVAKASAQHAPNGAVNDFALRLPPPTQSNGSTRGLADTSIYGTFVLQGYS